MQDIPGCYLSHPDNCFWVAETEVIGRAEILAMVAVVGRRDGEMCGELFRMIVSSKCRRTGLGSRMTQTVIDFCKERGFSKVVLETSSIQTSAVALYKKLGFSHILSHTKTLILKCFFSSSIYTKYRIMTKQKQVFRNC
uniref:N-acetyltransferase 8-like 2 n=1 Tax=Salmo trutta TaxID=8032 RepID=A0A674AYL4_SALTR